jgi:outer membrane protein TolC
MNTPSSATFEVDQTLAEGMGWNIPELDDLLDEGRTERQDLAAARFNLVARDKAVSEARSGFWPNISLFGQWNRSRQETPFRFQGTATEAQELSWGVQGSWNIFDRFQTKANARRSVAQRRRAEYDLRQAQLDFELEVVQIRNNLVEAKERHAVAIDTVEQAQEDLRLAEERFRVGAGTSLDVINAQVSLAQARRDEVDAQADFAKYMADLDRATGAR